MRRRQIQPKRGHNPRASVLARLPAAQPGLETPAEDERANLIRRLRNRDYAAKYLSAAFGDSPDTFLMALRNVADAQKGLARLADEAGVNRENLYRTLSQQGNPRLDTLWAVLKAIGLRVSMEPAGPRR